MASPSMQQDLCVQELDESEAVGEEGWNHETSIYSCFSGYIKVLDQTTKIKIDLVCCPNGKEESKRMNITLRRLCGIALLRTIGHIKCPMHSPFLPSETIDYVNYNLNKDNTY